MMHWDPPVKKFDRQDGFRVMVRPKKCESRLMTF